TRDWLNEAIGLQLPARLSGARLREELIPLLLERDPRPAFKLLSQWGALSFLVPNLKWEKCHETFFGQIARQKPHENTLLLRLLILLQTVPYPKAVGSLGHLMFPQKTIDQIEQALMLIAQTKDGSLSFADMQKAAKKPLPPEIKTFINKAAKHKA